MVLSVGSAATDQAATCAVLPSCYRPAATSRVAAGPLRRRPSAANRCAANHLAEMASLPVASPCLGRRCTQQQSAHARVQG